MIIFVILVGAASNERRGRRRKGGKAIDVDAHVAAVRRMVLNVVGGLGLMLLLLLLHLVELLMVDGTASDPDVRCRSDFIVIASVLQVQSTVGGFDEVG